MAKGFEIAEGYLDIQADTDGALKDVRRFFAEVDGELAAEEKSFGKSGERSGKNLIKGVESGAKGDVERVFKSVAEKAMSAVEGESSRRGGLLGALVGRRGGGGGASIGRSILGGLSASLRGARSLIGRAFSGLGSGLSSLFSGGTKLFKTITSGITDAISAGVDQGKEIFKSLSSTFSQISSVGSGLGGIVQVGAMGLAIPLVLGLAGALTHLAAAALAAPAAIAVLVAAIAPLIIAFKGFGEAVSAGLSGDMDKFNEALKGLTPSARAVAKEFVALKGPLSAIKKLVQESLFNQLVGQVGKLGTTLLPALATGMSGVAGALGHLIKLFIGLVSAPDTIRTLNNLFATTTRIIDTFAEPLVNLFGGLFDLINAGLPWVERFTHVLANGLQAGANWLEKLLQPGGKFTGWMERAWHVGVELWAVLKGLGVFAATVLSSLGDEGTDTLTGMADAIAKVNEYLKSAQGQETLHNLGVIVHWAGNAFVALLGATVGAYKGLNALFSFVRGIGPFFSKVWDGIVAGAMAVGHWFQWLGSTVWGGIVTAGKAIGGFFVMIWQGLVTAWNFLGTIGAAIVNFFVALPGRVGAFFMALPGMIGAAMTRVSDAILYSIGYLGGLLLTFWTVQLPGWIRTAWDWVYAYTAEGLAKTWARIQAFPGQVWNALYGLGALIGGIVIDAWNWAYAYTVEGLSKTWANIQAFPGRVWSALSGLGSMLMGIFSRAWDWAGNAIRTGITMAMQQINSIPGKVQGALSSAGSWLVSVGRNIMQGLINGISDSLGWAVQKAKDAANQIKRGFLDAFDIGSPSKVMQMEVGRWILPGVVKGMEDTEPQLNEYLGATADMIAGGMRPTVNVAAPNVNLGGFSLVADFGDGVMRAVPAALMRNSRTVAAATNVGNRQRTGWVNTGRAVITGATG